MNTEAYTLVNGLLGILYLAIFLALLYLGFWFVRTMIKKK